jgi:hypothetical protein
MSAAESPIPGWLGVPNCFTHDPLEPTILYTNTPWTIHVDWQTNGPANIFMVGDFHLHAYLESLGPATPDLDLYGADVALTPSAAPVISYLVHIPVAASTVTADHSGKLYKLVVSMTYRNILGAPGPIAAYAEGPILQFFNPS